MKRNLYVVKFSNGMYQKGKSTRIGPNSTTKDIHQATIYSKPGHAVRSGESIIECSEFKGLTFELVPVGVIELTSGEEN